MGAMYRLKAYFGMVPAEEMDDYADEPVGRYGDPRRAPRGFTDDRWHDRWDDRPAGRNGPGHLADDDLADDPYEERWERPGTRDPARPAGVERPREPARGPAAGGLGTGGLGTGGLGTGGLGTGGLGTGGLGTGAVRGALAVDPDRREPPHPPSPLREATGPPERVPAAAVPEQRDRGAAALSTITTLQPRSYNEARTIGERYRDGVPVIMNLTELDDAAAKRLVDFAAGLAFALRGSIDKVTNRVFLLTPADVEVSADDARKLAERGIFRQD
jgi:cell division inhibitor SepF